MKSFNVIIDTPTKVKNFVNIVSKCECDVDLVSGRYVIDAKSIMGIYSLDLSKPIRLDIHGDEDSILEELKEYICD